MATGLLNLYEFMMTYKKEAPFEWVNGQRVDAGHLVARQSIWLSEFYWLLRDYRVSGELFVRLPYLIMAAPDMIKTSRLPDALYITRARLEQLAQADPDYDVKPLMLVPDLVIDVILSDEIDVEKKVALYLEDGVQAVWVIDPNTQTITIHEQGSQQQTKLSGDNMLSGGNIMAGFEMSVRKLFEK